MKQVLQKLLLTLLASIAIGSTATAAVEIDGIWYTLYPSAGYAAIAPSPSAKLPLDSKGSLVYSESGDLIIEGNSYAGNLRIPESVTYDGIDYRVRNIASFAFAGCPDLKSIELPKSIEWIETSYANLFYGSDNITSIKIDSDNEKFKSETGCILSADGESLYAVIPSCTGQFVVPSTVKIIRQWAFSGSKVTSIDIGMSVNIETGAFAYADELESFIVNPSNNTYCLIDGMLVYSLAPNIPRILSCPAKKSGIVKTEISDWYTISDYAFAHCRKLTDISINGNVLETGACAFLGCTNLLDLKMSGDIGSDMLIGVTSLKHFTHTSNLLSDNDWSELRDMFHKYCPFLESISIVKDGYTWENGAIYYTDSKKKERWLQITPRGIKGDFEIVDNTNYISAEAFYKCSGITSVKIPNSVTTIGRDAFAGCDKLSKLTVPALTAIGYGAFSTLLKPLYFKAAGMYSADNLEKICMSGPGSDSGLGLNPGSVIIFEDEVDPSLNKKYPDVTITSNTPWYISDFARCIGGATWRVVKNEYYQGDDCPVKIYLKYLNSVNDTPILPDGNGLYSLMNLGIETEYSLICDYGNGKTTEHVFKTLAPTIAADFETTQTTFTLKSLTCQGDKSFTPSKIEFSLSKTNSWNPDLIRTYKGSPVKVKGLTPNSSYTLFVSVEGKGLDKTYSYMQKFAPVSTKGANPRITSSDLGPTSVVLKGTYDAGDAKVKRAYFYQNLTEPIEGDNIILNGLDPEKRYGYGFRVEFEEGGYDANTIDFTTYSLRLATLDPKCVSSTCAIVGATTNMSDHETNAGFQWKKYAAPESLKPSEGLAAIYDSRLEGYIRNLQPTSYYNVRAFYKSNAGNYYYGDWVAFDPSDFSYFEPTVHTYDVTVVDHSSAAVRGYVMAGTDDIVEQGFEYWRKGSVKVFSVQSEQSQDVLKVLSTGQVMTATISNLDPLTTYGLRAYVKTAAGTTYGEEQEFTTTEGESGVEGIAADACEVEIVGYFDLNGRRYDAPKKGFNIILYSDGKAEKRMIK